MRSIRNISSVIKNHYLQELLSMSTVYLHYQRISTYIFYSLFINKMYLCQFKNFIEYIFNYILRPSEERIDILVTNLRYSPRKVATSTTLIYPS